MLKKEKFIKFNEKLFQEISLITKNYTIALSLLYGCILECLTFFLD